MKTVIVTTTSYQDTSALRFKLACQLIRKAVKAGYPIIVVDGSPPDAAIKAELIRCGAMVYSETQKGMGAGRRQAFFHAYQLAIGNPKIGVFLWTEPEKVDLVRLIPKIVAPIEKGEAMVVIPVRTKKSWGTYPTFQVTTEQQANAAYNNLVYRDISFCTGFDPMFGPVAFSRAVANQFVCFDPNRYDVPDTYIQQFVPLVVRKDDGFASVGKVNVDFEYPSEQRAEEEAPNNLSIRQKRQTQCETLCVAYRAMAQALHL